MRRISALLATGLMTTAALVDVTPAQAQSSNIADSKVTQLAFNIAKGDDERGLADKASSLAQGGFNHAQCGALETALVGLGFTNFKPFGIKLPGQKQEVTRSQLVKNLAEKYVNDPALRTSSYPLFNIIGDRALECKIVEPDPATALTSAVDTSSNLSSQLSLPDFSTLLYLVDLPEGLNSSLPGLSSKPQETTDSEGPSIKLSS